MPDTPVTWLDEFTVNLTTGGSQARPRIVHLTNGNILVTWHSDNDTGVGSPPDVDIIGQLFTPLGVRIGTEFLVNSGDSGALEFNPAIAALPSGGFLTVYQRVGGGFFDIVLTEHDASGTVVAAWAPFFDNSPGAAPSGSNPRVAVSSDASALVVWQESGPGGGKIVGRIYDSSTNTLGLPITLMDEPGLESAPDVTALINGNYVITAVHNNGGDNEILIRIVNAAGGNVQATTVFAGGGNGHSDTQPTVTALTGGGFVIAWTNNDSSDTDIFFSSGGFGGIIPVTSVTGTDNAGEPVVVALADGGFLVLHVDATENNLAARRFDAVGNSVGSEFVISVGAGITQPDAERMADGRVAITFVRADGEVGMEIIDVRDAPNDPGVYGTAAVRVGTVGDDVFTTVALDQRLYGHTGNDIFLVDAQSSFGGDTIDGGTGFDRIRFTSTTGGETLVLSNLVTGIQVAEISDAAGLLTGTTDLNLDASAVGNGLTINGNDGDNTLTGTAFADIIRGGGGVDTINAGGGNDIVFFEGGEGNLDSHDGGADIDTINGNGSPFGSDATFNLATGFFFINGVNKEAWQNFENYTNNGTGTETVIGTNGVNIITTGSGANTLMGLDGADQLDGGGGIDVMIGGFGSDTYFADVFNDIIFEAEAMLAFGGDDLVNYSGTGAFTLSANVERLTLTHATANVNGTGNTLLNTIIGNTKNNVLSGGADTLADILNGGLGNDTYVLGASTNDIVQETGGITRGIDTVTSTINRSLAVAALTSIENLTLLGGAVGTGNALNNVITGNAGANVLDGGIGNDTLSGLNGNDILIGGLGKDTLTGGAHNDMFRFLNKTHSLVGANADRIVDFDDPGKGNDRIDVSLLFGPRMAYVHAAAFTKAGQVRINDIAGADVIVEVNTGGTLAADFAIRLTGTTLASMTKTDFVL